MFLLTSPPSHSSEIRKFGHHAIRTLAPVSGAQPSRSVSSPVETPLPRPACCIRHLIKNHLLRWQNLPKDLESCADHSRIAGMTGSSRTACVRRLRKTANWLPISAGRSRLLCGRSSSSPRPRRGPCLIVARCATAKSAAIRCLAVAASVPGARTILKRYVALPGSCLSIDSHHDITLPFPLQPHSSFYPSILPTPHLARHLRVATWLPSKRTK